MRRSIESTTPRSVPGWNTTSDDYLEHISTMVRTLSVNPNVSQYPTLYGGFRNGPASNEVRNGALPSQYQKDLPQQKVEAVSERDRKKNEGRGGSTALQADADGLAQQRQVKLHLSKWKTFRQ
ncbi:hypothetical protein BT93_K0241 [Corymbia citriodora subsp. variegata]|nr:hypothetical protein BT93_K0241 [Corymbia citriodora subsp. variegata]